LNDEQLADEIRLVGDLVLAASQSDDRLTQDAIDAVLSLEPAGATDGDVAPSADPARTPPEHGAA
jgi:hypothetical protein